MKQLEDQNKKYKRHIRDFKRVNPDNYDHIYVTDDNTDAGGQFGGESSNKDNKIIIIYS